MRLNLHRTRWLGAGALTLCIATIAWLGLRRAIAQVPTALASTSSPATATLANDATQPSDDRDETDATSEPTTEAMIATTDASTRSSTTQRFGRGDQFGARSDREDRRSRYRSRNDSNGDGSGRSRDRNADRSASSSASSQPTTGSSGEALWATTRPIDDSFVVLKTRSIFTRAHVSSDPRGSGSSSNAGVASTRPSRPEDALIFTGVTDVDGTTVAFIEDSASGRTDRVRTGDSIARGRVTAITLESLEYESNGEKTQIQLGQNLAGVSTVPAASTGSPAAGNTPNGGPGAAPGSPAPGGASNDILERLRRARQEGK